MTTSLYLTDKQVAERFGVSRETIWRWRRDGDFPKARKLSAGMTKWRLDEIEAWEAAREMCFVTALPPGLGEVFGGKH